MLKANWEKEYPLGALLLKGAMSAGEVFLYSAVVYFFWNYVVAKIGAYANFKLANYWHAVALFILTRFLLNDHLIASDPVIVHCDCGHSPEEEAEKIVIDDNKCFCSCGQCGPLSKHDCGRSACYSGRK